MVKTVMKLAFGGAFFAMASAFPWYYGEEVVNDAPSATFGFDGESPCGQLPEVGDQFSPHGAVQEETAATIAIEVDGNELAGCYQPGAEHTIMITFPQPRYGLIYLGGGAFTSEQVQGASPLPSDCENTRRTLLGEAGPEESYTLVYTADDSGEGLTGGMVSASGPTANHQLLLLEVPPCEGLFDDAADVPADGPADAPVPETAAPPTGESTDTLTGDEEVDPSTDTGADTVDDGSDNMGEVAAEDSAFGTAPWIAATAAFSTVAAAVALL